MKTQIVSILILATILRVVPIIYISQFENISNQELTFTDIDYKVYTDAANYDSPYDRHTYRYTPILAYFMMFNKEVQWAGKIIFVLFDLVAIVGLWVLMKPQYQSAITKLYAYNPLFIYLTARGSCESISMALMYWTCYFIFKHNGNSALQNRLSRYTKISENQTPRPFFGYCLYGLWVHFRVYPIIFLPLLLANELAICKKSKTSFLYQFLKVGLASGLVFGGLMLLFYRMYGFKFIEETYLYHLNRLDNRHSFSPLFYEIYLSLSLQTAMKGFVRSIPQIYVIFLASRKLHSQISPFYAIFLITYGFVNFNKVITMQYYMWMWGSLLILLPESSITTNSKRRWRTAFNLTIQWVLGILIWVWTSIRVEKQGINMLNFMWFICVIKLLWDLWVVSGFLQTIKNVQGYEPIKSH